MYCNVHKNLATNIITPKDLYILQLLSRKTTSTDIVSVKPVLLYLAQQDRSVLYSLCYSAGIFSDHWYSGDL